MRIGYGYDIHRLVPGRKLILGGVEIPADKGLDGHSDADVLLHALADALLGAAALGDIGKHFPNTDERFRGISSLVLLGEVGALLRNRQYAVINIDATVILEQPKIGPYVEAMQEKIADTLGIPVSAVSIKATTGEGIGFVGRVEGAAAHAIALIHKHA
ncbi:MAG: 2-C-methyl-D-erythritol 2,4-cyclodiphosphate synthase [Bacteroidota bacterium]